MKKADNTPKRMAKVSIPSGNEEEESPSSARADRAPSPGSSIAQKIAIYQARLALATAPPNASTVSLPLPSCQQGELPLASVDDRQEYPSDKDVEVGVSPVPDSAPDVPAPTGEAGATQEKVFCCSKERTADDDVLKKMTDASGKELPPSKNTEPEAELCPIDAPSPCPSKEKITNNEPRLAPATMPPEPMPIPMYQEQQESVTAESVDEESVTESVDEEVGILTRVSNTNDRVPNDEAQEAYSAYLAPDPEAQRRAMMEQAVSAINVHVITPRRHAEGGNKGRLALASVVMIVLTALAISLGITLSRRHKHDLPMPVPSTGPTQAPTSARFGQVASLVQSGFNTTSLDDPTSPQYQAAQWMADDDMAFEDLSTVDPGRFLQRYALAVFYYATGGPSSWIERSFFLKPDTHECKWWDAAPKDTTSWSKSIGVFNCSREQWVQGLEINQNNLTGTLPKELGLLSSLINFTVIGNHIGGTLSPSLFNLSELQEFLLWENEITGTIPTEIRRASSLGLLLMPENFFTGTIPSEIGSLSNLVELGLGRNLLTGSIPKTLLQLSRLTLFDVGVNFLTGKLPPSLFLSLPNLKQFGVWKNHLTGTIPNDLDSLFLLEELVLGFNDFTGPFPSSIVSLKHLVYFGAEENDLTGSLPNNWDNLSLSLEWLQVDNNRLTGTLPESLGNLRNLSTLYFHYNEFDGTIPESIGNLTALQALSFGGNRLSGTVPESFAQLTSLSQLLLHYNKFTGDLSFLCSGNDMLLPGLVEFFADCLEEINCPCCNICCNIYDACLDMLTDQWY